MQKTRAAGTRRTWPCRILAVILSATWGLASPAMAQQGQGGPAAPAAAQDKQIVDYSAGFFSRYQPNTALDMVRQVPGFLLDDGDDERGFGGAVGNILINDRRPSAKQDLPSEILARIPAGNVRRIELIRGQVRGVDLQGYAVVANVVLRQDSPAMSRWEVSLRHNVDFNPPTFDGSISTSDRWRGIEYNVGIGGRHGSSGDAGLDRFLDSAGELTQITSDDSLSEAYNGSGNLNASTWLGETFVQLNTELFFENRDRRANSIIRSGFGSRASGQEIIDTDQKIRRLELGTDAERLLQQDLLGKAIFLFSYLGEAAVETERNLDAAGDPALLRAADTDTVTTETIGRLEFDWARWDNHTVQANFELAYNALDNELLRTDDTGAGPVPVDVPGANSRVEELRGDIQMLDTWTLGAFELDYGLGAEVSRLSQSGDAELERDFFFLKPQALFTWSPSQREQSRMRVAREVAQLDFNDFVSATVFEDDDLALGNPDLRPEATWVAEVAHERRFGELGVVTLTAFHHWITDVQDLLPITDEFEAPGNIGDGRRWGLELESTVPLEWLGLTGARLDLQGRWQDSSVTDPVTGEKRVLSAEGTFPKPLPIEGDNEYAWAVNYRQDLQQARVAWGWEVRERGERPLFKVNELEVLNETTELNAFIETTRWWGLKIRLEGQDILDFNQSRDRTIFTGLRGLSPLDRLEVRERVDGARIFASVSGNF